MSILAEVLPGAHDGGVEPVRGLRMTEEQYLAFEATAREKHEYVNGEVIAMAGAEPEHNIVRDGFATALNRRFDGKPCVAISADQRVRIDETRLYTYPDIVVVCGTPRFDDAPPRSSLNPQIIVEVLSDSTEAYDRGAKFSHYQRCASIEEYVLVASKARRIEHYRRSSKFRWTLTVYDGEGEIELPTIDVRVPMQEIYEKLALLTAGPAA